MEDQVACNATAAIVIGFTIGVLLWTGILLKVPTVRAFVFNTVGAWKIGPWRIRKD